jgi:hypothetical protein
MAWPRISSARPASGEIRRRCERPRLLGAAGLDAEYGIPLVVAEAAMLLILALFFGT